jgi:uncharacterized protein (TIGR02246 family)
MRILALAIVFTIAVIVAAAQQAGTRDDEAAIRRVVNHWQETWDKFDASVLASDFAEDADWLNAFGVRLKGQAKILEFMTAMVKRPNVQGRKTAWDEPDIRFLRPDVAVAYRSYRTVGHKTPDGKEMAVRDTHATWFLTKDVGRWHIASQVIYDANPAGAPQ